MGEKFCVRFFHILEKITKFKHRYDDKKYCQIYFKCFDNFSGGKNKRSVFTMYNIAMAYLITILVFGELCHFRMTIHYKPPLVAILESPNKHNLMTSFGIRLIAKHTINLIVIREGDDGGTHSQDHAGMDLTVSISRTII